MTETQETGIMTKINNCLGKFARKHPKIYVGSLVALLAGSIYGAHKISEMPKPEEPNFLEIITDKKYIQRNGSRVYLGEDWYRIDDNTEKRGIVIYVDKDNNGFPEASCTIIDSYGSWITDYDQGEFEMLKMESFGKGK